MTKQDKYLKVCHKLHNRYYDKANHKIVISIDGKPTNYAVLLELAAVKYLGCNPDKMQWISSRTV